MARVTLKGMLARKLRLTLTALAIVVGVMFVAGTLILTDTLHRTFDGLVGTAYRNISFEIRGQTTLTGVGNASPNSTADRRPIPDTLVTVVRRLPGVGYAYGSVAGYAQFVARDGSAIGGAAHSNEGFSFDPNSQLSPLRLVRGGAPTGPGEVVMDRATATKYGFTVGDRVRVLLPGAPQTFRISGLVTFGDDGNLAGTTLAGFSLTTAQALFNSRGHYDSINVLAKPGTDQVALQRAIADVLPPGVEVVSGQTIANELYRAINNALSFLSTALLVFAFISLFVGAFTIANTFTITIGQRTRELALLRVVGAGRGQILRSVLAEAAITGLVASAIGLGLGVLAALGLKALLKGFGITLPSAPLVFEARTVVASIAVGVGVTLLSAVAPARRAVRIPPIAALAEHVEDTAQAHPQERLIGGGTALFIALIAIVKGVLKPAIGLVGLGALAGFIAAVLLLPLFAGPLAGGLGRPLANLTGAPGSIGLRNATRNPRRTAQTAAALMIGLMLVSTVAVLGASLSSSATQSIDSAVSADYVIGGSGRFSDSVFPTVARLPGVSAITAVLTGQFDFKGSLESLGAVSTPGLSQTVNLHVTKGRGAAALAAGELLVDTTTARSDHVHVGSVALVTFAQTGSTTIRVGGIFKPNSSAGSYIVSARYFLAHFDHPLLDAVLVRTAPGTRHFGATLNRALAAYPNLTIDTRAQFEAAQQGSVNQLLGLVYVLLALAVLVALIGIVNTLMLSVFERTREIGLLRAVGMRRGQVRAMIRVEAVVVSLLGAVVGVVVGTALGAALASSLRNNGITTVSIPFASLIGFLVLSALLGLAAASWPARRAANLDVLAAIAVE